MKTLSVALLIGIVIPWFCTVAFGAGDVIITEVNSTASAYATYVEIYNAGDANVDITNWTYEERHTSGSESRGEEQIGTTIGVLSPGEYALLLRQLATFESVYPSVPLTTTPDNDNTGIEYYVLGTQMVLNGGDDYIIIRSSSGGAVMDNFSNASGSWTDNHAFERVNYPNDGTNLSSHWIDLGEDKTGTPAAANDNSLPVTLSFFAAIPTDPWVMLKWRTESEVDHLGWNIYRSEKKDGKFLKINKKLIPGAGNSAMPNSYQFVDKTAIKGRQYYYYLEDVDIAGMRNKSSIIPISKDAKKLTTTWSKIKKG